MPGRRSVKYLRRRTGRGGGATQLPQL